jgi:hypothetical protein
MDRSPLGLTLDFKKDRSRSLTTPETANLDCRRQIARTDCLLFLRPTTLSRSQTSNCSFYDRRYRRGLKSPSKNAAPNLANLQRKVRQVVQISTYWNKVRLLLNETRDKENARVLEADKNFGLNQRRIRTQENEAHSDFLTLTQSDCSVCNRPSYYCS